MENDIFKAGVQPGGPTSHDEIKMLICYILSKVGRPMSFAQLHEALSENNLVNYFELVRAVEGLAKTGHINVNGDGAEQYTLTEVGVQAAEAFESALPLSVREKAVQAAEKLLKQQQRASEVSINIRSSGGGFLLELAIPEAGGNLVSFTLFAPTREECDAIKRRFLNDPLYIYKGVLALLTGNEKVLGEMFPQKELLF